MNFRTFASVHHSNSGFEIKQSRCNPQDERLSGLIRRICRNIRLHSPSIITVSKVIDLARTDKQCHSTN